MDLPRGKFNRADNIEPSDSNGTVKSASLISVQFVKSSIGLPGTIETSPESTVERECLIQREENQTNKEIEQPEAEGTKASYLKFTKQFFDRISQRGCWRVNHGSC